MSEVKNWINVIHPDVTSIFDSVDQIDRLKAAQKQKLTSDNKKNLPQIYLQYQ